MEPEPSLDAAPIEQGAPQGGTSPDASGSWEPGAADAARYASGAARAPDAPSGDLDGGAMATGAVVTETASRSGGGGSRRTTAPKARKARRAGVADAEAPSPARDDAGGDLAALRAAAWPLSAPPSTRSRAPEGWATVDAARQGGDTAALQSALDALIRGADDAVAQEAAWELARLDLQRGRRDLALVSIARGLGRPGGHPLAQSRLLALQGEVLEQRGDAAGAKESYRRAVRVR